MLSLAFNSRAQLSKTSFFPKNESSRILCHTSVPDLQLFCEGASGAKHYLYEDVQHSACGLLYAPYLSVAIALRSKIEEVISPTHLEENRKAHLKFWPGSGHEDGW